MTSSPSHKLYSCRHTYTKLPMTARDGGGPGSEGSSLASAFLANSAKMKAADDLCNIEEGPHTVNVDIFACIHFRRYLRNADVQCKNVYIHSNILP